jgi:hypothetical protein
MKHLHLILICALLNACAYPAAKPESKESAKKVSTIPVTKAVARQAVKRIFNDGAFPKTPVTDIDDASVTFEMSAKDRMIYITTNASGRKKDNFPGLLRTIIYDALNLVPSKFQDHVYTFDPAVQKSRVFLDPRTELLFQTKNIRPMENGPLDSYTFKTLSSYHHNQFEKYLQKRFHPTKSISPCKDCELRRTQLFDGVTTPETPSLKLSSTSKPEPLYPALAPPAPTPSTAPSAPIEDIFAGMTIHTQEPTKSQEKTAVSPQPDIFDGLLAFVDVPTRPLSTKPDVKPAKKEAVIVEMA